MNFVFLSWGKHSDETEAPCIVTGKPTNSFANIKITSGNDVAVALFPLHPEAMQNLGRYNVETKLLDIVREKYKTEPVYSVIAFTLRNETVDAMSNEVYWLLSVHDAVITHSRRFSIHTKYDPTAGMFVTRITGVASNLEVLHDHGVPVETLGHILPIHLSADEREALSVESE